MLPSLELQVWGSGLLPLADQDYMTLNLVVETRCSDPEADRMPMTAKLSADGASGT